MLNKCFHRNADVLYLFFLLTWSQEVGQTAEEAPNASIVLIFIQQRVKGAEELEDRLSVSDHIIRD